MAVGLGMDRTRIKPFYAEIEENIRLELTKDDLVDHIDFDGEVELFELDSEFFNLLDSLSPFGHSNSKPMFRLNNLECVKTMPIGGKHSRGILRDKRNYEMEFIAFNRSVDSLPNATWDVIASPQINEYYGENRPQLQIIDLQPSY
jgi:single-stranded-DNA-specific exonuclease